MLKWHPNPAQIHCIQSCEVSDNYMTTSRLSVRGAQVQYYSKILSGF